jgi:hypothetical protein
MTHTEPIFVDLELGVGDIRITASDRTETVVEVRPSDPTSKADVTAAEQTRVEFADGRLSVMAPKGWRYYSRGGHESIDVEIYLPAGSRLDGEAGMAALSCTGRVGELRYKTGVGAIRLDETGPVQVRTGAGDISVESAAGRVEMATGSGAVEVGAVDGSAMIKNSNGDTWISDVTGELRATAANGKDRRRPAAGDHPHQDGQRRHPAGSRGPRRGRRRDRLRQRRHRRRRRRPGLARAAHELRQRAQRSRRRHPTGRGRRGRRGPRPNRLRRHHDPPSCRHRAAGSTVMSALATAIRSAVRVTGMRKAFGAQVVLDRIDLEIAEGTVFALLRPNREESLLQSLRAQSREDVASVHPVRAGEQDRRAQGLWVHLDP